MVPLIHPWAITIVIPAAPNDYSVIPHPTMLILSPTLSETIVSVRINDDDIVEDAETFFGTLDNPEGDPVIINPPVANVTIEDADDSMLRKQ